MLEVLTAVAIVVNLIRPPQPYPYPQQPYYPQPVPNVQTQERNYPTEYQTPMGTRNWSQAGQETYRYGQPTQTPKNSLWP